MFERDPGPVSAFTRDVPDPGGVERPPGVTRPLLLVGAAIVHDSRLGKHLQKEGFAIRPFDNADAALAHLAAAADVSLVAIDIDGLGVGHNTLLERFLATRFGTPVAVIANSDDETIEEAVLDLGAHEFLCRHRRPSILAKRLRLLAESTGGPSPRPGGTAHVGGLSLRLASHRAAWHGQPVPLTLTEFKIVRLLASRAGDEVSYREIYDEVHGVGFNAGDGPDGFRTNVRSLIRKIRAKFRALDEGFDRIENYPGFGYRWLVSADAGELAAAPPRTPAQDTAVGRRPSAAATQHPCSPTARRAS